MAAPNRACGAGVKFVGRAVWPPNRLVVNEVEGGLKGLEEGGWLGLENRFVSWLRIWLWAIGGWGLGLGLKKGFWICGWGNC